MLYMTQQIPLFEDSDPSFSQVHSFHKETSNNGFIFCKQK